MTNLLDLKNMMNKVPDHKMYHDKPMKGPIKDKKEEMAQKMPVKITQAELQARRESKNPGKYSEEAKKKNRDMINQSMSKAGGISEEFKKSHQSRVGRAFTD